MNIDKYQNIREQSMQYTMHLADREAELMIDSKAFERAFIETAANKMADLFIVEHGARILVEKYSLGELIWFKVYDALRVFGGRNLHRRP